MFCDQEVEDCVSQKLEPLVVVVGLDPVDIILDLMAPLLFDLLINLFHLLELFVEPQLDLVDALSNRWILLDGDVLLVAVHVALVSEGLN